MTSRHRIAPLQASHLIDTYSNSLETLKSLKLLLSVLKSSYGTSGQVKLMRNACGGHVTLTTSSSRMLSMLSSPEPLIRLILEAGQEHVKAFGDGGLFMPLLTLNMVICSQTSYLRPQVIGCISSHLLHMALEYLNSEGCGCKISAGVPKVEFLLSVIKGVLATKTACNFLPGDVDLVSKIILEVFITSLPDDSKITTADSMHILCFDGQPVCHSSYMKGLLIETSLLLSLEHQLDLFKSRTVIRTMVIDVSMSGDSAELLNVPYRHSNQRNIDEDFLKYLDVFCSQAISREIDVVFCQKVVHPRLKQQLRYNGILVVDRLGRNLCHQVLSLIGADPTSSLAMPIAEGQIGVLDSVTLKTVCEKSYLHLEKANSNITTLVLCASFDETLQEFKSVCSNTLHVLKQAVRQPSALLGGGCWQLYLASYLRNKTNQEAEILTKELNISIAQFLEGCRIFICSLEQTALIGEGCCTDKSRRHVWRMPPVLTMNSTKEATCCCGMVSSRFSDLEEFTCFSSFSEIWKPWKENHLSTMPFDGDPASLVLDSFAPWINSLKTGVSLAVMIMNIKHCIYDVN